MTRAEKKARAYEAVKRFRERNPEYHRKYHREWARKNRNGERDYQIILGVRVRVKRSE